VVVEVLKLVSRKVHGDAPTDMQIKWPSLRILNAKEQEEVKDRQFLRVKDAFTNGLCEDYEAKQAINAASLLLSKLTKSSPEMRPWRSIHGSRG